MVLLRWWFLVVCELAALSAAAFNGALVKLWEVDVTKLSIACIAALLLVTGFIGWLTREAAIMAHRPKANADLLPHVDACWFISEVLMGLGMTGTVFGFLIMLNDAFTGNMAAQEVMLRAAPGLGTICVTTAVGLICSMFCKAQLVNLDYLLPRDR